MRVLKFGGTSVATPERLAEVAEIVAAAGEPVVVVVSALAGVTDALAAAFERAAGGDPEVATELCRWLAWRHLDGFRARLGEPWRARFETELATRLGGLERLLRALARRGERARWARDLVLATGERLSLPLAAAFLQRRGLATATLDGAALIEARAVGKEEAEVDFEATRTRVLARLTGAAPVVVVSGFVAADAFGRTLTLGRCAFAQGLGQQKQFLLRRSAARKFGVDPPHLEVYIDCGTVNDDEEALMTSPPDS